MILKFLTVVLLFFGVLEQSSGQILLKLSNLLKMQQGLGWPHTLIVAEGNEALLRLNTILVNQHSCLVTTPTGLTFNTQSPPSIRFESWSDACGVRVRNMNKDDQGRWRLIATQANHSVTGWTEVYVQEKVPMDKASPISVQDGQTNTRVELTTLENSYCIVAKPFSDSSLVPGHCSVTLDRATRAVQGNWNVLLGLPGQVSELPVLRKVAVETERLDVGYVHDTNVNKLHLYCNILHTSKNVTFCRFQKTSESFGYNIIDGLSDGSYSYYGEGFPKRQCGMTVENPTAQDYGTWRCSLGVQMWVGNQIQPQNPMQALISVAPNTRSGHFIKSENEMRKVFVQKDMPFTLMCQADVSLQYCWFQHPNGSQFSPGQLVDENQLYWYTGESLQTGACGITFKEVIEEDAGKWICHMGPRKSLGAEVTDVVEVRVTGPLAANEQKVGVKIGSDVTLYCHTANGRRPLDYCRFLTPTRVGIRIDSTVTEDMMILNRFYFTPNRSLDYGDCSLNIKSVTQEDMGEWTCAAMISGDVTESRDILILHVDQTAPQLAQAGIIGMSVGLVTLVGVLVGFLWYKRRLPLCHRKSQEPHSRVTFHNRNTGSVSSDDASSINSRVVIAHR